MNESEASLTGIVRSLSKNLCPWQYKNAKYKRDKQHHENKKKTLVPIDDYGISLKKCEEKRIFFASHINWVQNLNVIVLKVFDKINECLKLLLFNFTNSKQTRER